MVGVTRVLVSTVLVGFSLGQTFRRSAACPTLGCIFPPDQTDFVAGAVFDIRVEAQAPNIGPEAYNGGVANPAFSLSIVHAKAPAQDVLQYFKLPDSPIEAYNFTYFADLFAKQNGTSTTVAVAAKSYRHVALYEPGSYVATLTYNNGQKTVANWVVQPVAKHRVAKNVILFIGDGMTTAMITAARLLAHKSINGKYQSLMKVDGAPAYGSQMTHSLDSFITDSANSATALMSGKKSTVNALNTYTDSSGKPLSDPKFETVFELGRRIYNARIGIVTTAYIADATPAAVCAHTSQRSQYASIITQFLVGITNYPWTRWNGPDVLFGGGAEYFLPNKANNMTDQYALWAAKNYSIVHDKQGLAAVGNDAPVLGMFSQGNIATWLDRNVYQDNLKKSLTYNGTAGTNDLPGLKDMTIKAIDILSARSKAGGDTGFMLMSEAASIDKQMHVLDYQRALGELMELDNTVAAVLEHLAKIGELDDTLVIVTADHGHGFDVFGSADTAYLEHATTDRSKRDAIGTYVNSGLSEYQVPFGVAPNSHDHADGPNGPGFPNQWNVRYGIAAGMAAGPDHREDYKVDVNGPRLPADVLSNATADANNYYTNPLDAIHGFNLNGTLPVSNEQGVHSLTDVPVYAWGPGSELFRGVQNSPDIAYKISLAMNLGRTKNATMLNPKKFNKH